MAESPSAQAASNLQPEPARRGIGAIDIGMRLIDVLTDNGPMKLKDIAAAAGLPAPKAHRYLASFASAGMVAQAGRSSAYELGPMALRVGVAALERHDVVQQACAALPDLRDDIRATCFVAGWSDWGPIILRWEDSLRPVTVIVQVGSTLPLLRSATGRTFLTFLPDGDVAKLVEQELVDAGRSRANALKEIEALIEDTRAQGLGQVAGDFQPGIASLAAPLFTPLGKMVGAVTALGRDGDFDADLDGPIAKALRLFAGRVAGAGA